MRLAMTTKKTVFWMLAALALWLPGRAAAAEGTWIPLQTSPSEGIGTMLLMPDGTVMAQGGGGGHTTTDWFKLTPSSTGGYTNGVWTTRTSDNYNRIYYSSDVLTNGKVFFAGAEYGNGTTNAEIYDPASDHWSIVPIPSGIITTGNTATNNNQNDAGFADSDSVLLSNGKVLVLPVYPATNNETVIYDPVANSWSSAYLVNNVDNLGDEDEASSVKLPDDSILVVDSGDTTSERYIPSLNQWVTDSNAPVQLYDPTGGEEGAGLLLPNGNAFFIGSTPQTAIYIPSGSTNPGTWIQGPNIPNGLGAPDAPAAMMNNGKILCALSPTPFFDNSTNNPQHTNIFTTPTYFYEYDYSAGPTGSFTLIHTPSGNYTNGDVGPVTFPDRMLDLPDGTVLFTDGSANLYVYKPAVSPLAAGKPAINSVSWNADGSLHLSGTLFNGISEGAAYGDDAQMDSNYPLVRFTDGSGYVSYGTTYNWSSTSVQTGSKIVTTECTLPANVLTNGSVAYLMQVVANGNASAPVTFFGSVWVDFNYGINSPQIGTFANPYSTLARGTNAVSSGGTISIKPGTSAETMKISKPMKLIAVGGKAIIGQQ
jgi:hypothetical protein